MASLWFVDRVRLEYPDLLLPRVTDRRLEESVLEDTVHIAGEAGNGAGVDELPQVEISTIPASRSPTACARW